MPIDAPLAALLVAVSLVALAGCDRKGRCGPAPDKSVVACVGDEPVRSAEAVEFLRGPEWVPGSTKRTDPKKAAVDRAVQRAMLAQEGQRRGLPLPAGAPPSRAATAQALVASELAKLGVEREKIPLDEARRFYDEHPEAFGQVDGVHVQAIIVAEPAKAEQAYREAQGADESRFAELVARYSEDAPSREKKGELPPIHASKSADRELLTLGMTLRRKGAIGGPVKAADGRYYVVRIESVELGRVTPWDEQSQAKARNIVVFERKEALIRELAADLVKRTTVQTFDDAVAALPDSPPSP